jgi:hypothetical protein
MMTLLADGRPDDEVLVQYLLGTLPETEAERIDELSIADDEVAWRMRAVENDLVDAYVLGQLAGATLDQFTSRYLTSPIRRQRVEFATTLLSAQVRNVPTTRFGVRRGVLPRWALAAAALIAAVGVGYLALENQRLRDQVDETEAARTRGEQTAEALRSELEQERSASAAARSQLEQTRQPVPSARGRSSIQALVLLPLRRGAGDIPIVSIAPGTGELPLRLHLEGGAFPRYQAIVRDSATGQTVWRSGSLEARSDGANRAVAVGVPVRLLRSANYTVEVMGLRRNDAAELASSYAFRVMLE